MIINFRWKGSFCFRSTYAPFFIRERV